MTQALRDADVEATVTAWVGLARMRIDPFGHQDTATLDIVERADRDAPPALNDEPQLSTVPGAIGGTR